LSCISTASSSKFGLSYWRSALRFGTSAVILGRLCSGQRNHALRPKQSQRTQPAFARHRYEYAADGASSGVVELLTNRFELLDELERLVGPIPLSLHGWYENVGAVNLMGTHSSWPQGTADLMPDPLVIDPLDIVLTDARERLADPEWGTEETRCLYVASDDYHKENISGGPPYSLLMQAAADAPLLFEWHNTTFVDYLRQAFRWGGFPGFARYSDYPKDTISFLASGLLPIWALTAGPDQCPDRYPPWRIE
jgi:hypothetical protein